MQDPHHSFVSLILAAGKGTRMQSSGTLPGVHKVCLPLDGIPVIERAIRTYERCGAEAHAIVVGAQAEQVIQAATAAPGQQMFCFQAEQRGTGHATRVAADMLRAVGYTGNILVVAGDKVIDDHALHHLVARFHEREADLAFLVGRTADFPTAGRIVEGPDDTALAITEVADIRRAALLCDLRRETSGGLLEVETVRRKALEAFSSEKKARQALGPLWEAVEDGLPLTAEGLAGMFPPEAFTAPAGSRRLPPEDFEPLRYANLSVYLFRAPVLYEALDALSSDNAQQEEYLTDTVAILAERKRSVVIVPLGAPDEVMAYNTPEEFQAIEHRLASRRAASHAKPRTVED